jgi:hypothetical protein
LVAQVAVALHVLPSAVWAMDPQDFATVIHVITGADDEDEEVDWWQQAFE